MSPTFLVPLFLLGLAGIVIPIIVHLTRRQRRHVVTFPSLMFLRKIPFQEQRRRRIQHWLLFVMRSLALGLLAVAFDHPALHDHQGFARQHALDPVVERAAPGGELQLQHLLARLLIDPGLDQPGAHQSLGLGGEGEAFRILDVIKRLDAERVTRQDQLAGLGIVDGDGI